MCVSVYVCVDMGFGLEGRKTGRFFLYINIAPCATFPIRCIFKEGSTISIHIEMHRYLLNSFALVGARVDLVTYN